MAKKEINGAKQMLYMTERDREDLHTLSDLTGLSVSEIVRDSLADKLDIYRNSIGRIDAIPAIYIDGTDDEEHECVVLSAELRFGQNYILIYYNNTLSKVPEACIRYIDRKPVAYRTVFFSCTNAKDVSNHGYIGYTDNTNWIISDIEKPPFVPFLSGKKAKATDMDRLLRSRVERAITEDQIKDARAMFESEDHPKYRAEFKMMNTETVMKELKAVTYYVIW